MKSSLRQKTVRSEAEGLLDTLESPLGRMYIIYRNGGRGRKVILLHLGFSMEKASEYLPSRIIRKTPLPASVKDQFSRYFRGSLRTFSLNYHLEGTDFEKAVWEALKKIPYGETRTYQWLAREVGNPRGVRAVGQALSRNPLPIVLPCHRVIQSDGKLGGYSSGVDRKRRLLELEYYNTIQDR